MKFRKKPVVIDAAQWFKNGDHPDDAVTFGVVDSAGIYPTEGKVVRYYRLPGVPGESACKQCGKPHHVHGWIDTLEQGHRVCPGDWIITGVKGERYPCKPDIFAATYQPDDGIPAWDPSKPNREQGLYGKFYVERVDGSSAPGGKHHRCEYFVLDTSHDLHARAALIAYAVACKDTHPQLSADLAKRWAPAGVLPTIPMAGYRIRLASGAWRTMDSIGMPDETDDEGKALCFSLREHAETFAQDDPDEVSIVPPAPVLSESEGGEIG